METHLGQPEWWIERVRGIEKPDASSARVQ